MKLQEDLNLLYNWSSDWKIKFNPSKCKMMYLGKHNPKYAYNINGIILDEFKWK